MTQIELDIKKAIEMIKNPSRDYDEMNEYNKIYPNTTENIKDYMPYLAGTYHSALLPVASGDHLLEAIQYGIIDFTCFDINRLAKYFQELKLNAFKSLSEKEFIDFMYEDFLNKEYFDYFKNNLNDNDREFWLELYKNCDVESIRNGLFRFYGEMIISKGSSYFRYFLENYTTYLKHYKLVQEKLQKIQIKYLDGNLLELPDILNEKYDMINLTNIYEYINRDIFKGGAKSFCKCIKSLIPFLNENGKMLITYLYKCNAEEIEEFRNKSIFYAYVLYKLDDCPLAKYIHDGKNKKSYMDKLYAFRNSQLLRYMKDLNVETKEIEGTMFGLKSGEKDVALIYKKVF